MQANLESGQAVFEMLQSSENAGDVWIADAATAAAARHDAGFLQAMLSDFNPVGTRQAPGKASNLIRNSSFESESDGTPARWDPVTHSGQGTFSLSNNAHTGGRAVQISSEKGGDLSWATRIRVKPHTDYQLSGWIKTEGVVKISGARGAMFNIHELQDPVGGGTLAVTGTQDWTHVELTFNTGALEFITINCLYGGWGRCSGTAWFDDVTLVRAPGSGFAGETVIIPNRAPAKALIPANGTLGRSWTQPDFDDGDWKSGRTGIGYDYQGLINLDVRNMRGENETVYARIPFAFEENTNLDTLILRIRYDDGFIAYLNGTVIARDNAPSNPDWQSAATLNRPDNIAVNAVDVNISSAIDLLETGGNVLAIQGLNQGINSSDILILPELIAQLQSDAPETFGFMLAPSPGLPNNDSIQGITSSVEFSVASQVFDESFSLELSLPQDALPGTEIRYTEDGTRPNSSSNLYTTPLQVSETVQIRAISVLPSKGQSTVTSESYTGLNAQTRNFNSNLPVVVLENYQSGRPPQNSKQASFMMLYEPNDGRTRFNQAPTISTRSGIKVRGSSTSGRSKPSMSMEAWDEFDQNKNIAPLGMPSESDWVLWGPYNFDLSLMHNPFIYELSNQIGRYATRTRFVEVFLNTDGGPLDSNDYYGVYALMEKISRDQDRVDVARIFPEHNQEPGVTGGYIFKIDRADPGDSGFGGAGQNIRYVYPKEVEIERPERNDQ
ncbi:CotH kinase family protein, partial [bacterium]|nr:CotH kinase family protein [bacterium]